MRFWRSIVLPALAAALLIAPASVQAQSAKPPEVAKPADAAKPPEVAKPSEAAKPAPTAKVPKPAKATTPSEPRSSVPARRGWMIGFNSGDAGTRFVGTTQIVTGELRTDTPEEYPILLPLRHRWKGTSVQSAPSFQFRVGYAVNPSLMISFERMTWFKKFKDESWRFSSATFSATAYPRAGHFFVRGGAGVSALAEKIPIEAPFFIEAPDQGVSIEGAIGYEQRLYRRVSLNPELSIRSMNFGNNLRSQIGTASLGLNWWF